MTAVACLRILLPENQKFTDPEMLGLLVNKIGGAFLDTRWKWPRRWGAIAPFAFGLADPRALEFDPSELQALSTELQHKLFGDQGAGEVCLVTLAGAQEDIMRFATADAALLHEMIKKGGAAVCGQLNTITTSKITDLVTLDSHPPFPDETPTLPARVAPGAVFPAEMPQIAARPVRAPMASVPAAQAPARPQIIAPEIAAFGAPEPETADRGFRGVYHTLRELFVGSILVARPDAKTPLWSVVDGPRDMPVGRTVEHDLACLEAAIEALAKPGGLLFVPINYSAVVHGSVRRLYETAIAKLPISQRNRLAATIYETPRDPSWSAMSQLKTFLGPRFAYIDLQVTDPGFAVDKLPEEGVVTSVTFVLPEGEEKSRFLAAKRFMGGLDAFRKRRVWPGLTNVRTRRELAACIALRAPFVTGRAVTSTLRAAPDATHRPAGLLPLRSEQLAHRTHELAPV